MKLGLFLDGEWSHNFLNQINRKKFKISFVVGRFKLDTKLKEICKKKKIPFFTKKNVNSKKTIFFIKKNNCDLFVSLSYDQIFKEEILSLYKNKIINCHAGYLPFYRGRNVLNWAIVNGEKYFGISTHFIDKGIDTGKIIIRSKYKISMNDTYNTILKKAFINCPKILIKTLNLIESKKKINLISQDYLKNQKFYYRKRNTNDEIINLSLSIEKIHNLIRSISYPGPKAKLFLKKKKIKIKSSKIIRYNKKFKFTKKINFFNNKIYIKENNLLLECHYE
jgi:methionyl-tRNA formyltransferase